MEMLTKHIGSKIPNHYQGIQFKKKKKLYSRFHSRYLVIDDGGGEGGVVEAKEEKDAAVNN